MIEINVEIPQREVIESTVTINAKPIITGVTASVDNNVGTPSVVVTPTGTGTEYSFDLAFHNLKGDQGETGNGIASIAKTSSTGLVDTYTITYDNGNTKTFDVTNGNGIASIAKTATVDLVDTYTITLDNGDTETFDVTNGNGIVSIEKTSTAGLVDTYTITFDNGDTETFNITNGADGQAATIAVGTVTTGNAGTNASVTNSGTSSAAVFDFVIPRGDTGATGVSVTGVTLISTVGLDKTYRMSFSDGNYFDFVVKDGAAGSTTWGGISGTLSNQTDLQSALDDKADETNRINGAPLSNGATVFFGTSSSAADATEKVVSIPSITHLDTGTVIVVQPTTTSTVANSTIKLNGFAAYEMRYNNAAVSTTTDSVVWSSAYVSAFVFDGTYWQFLCHGLDSNTTYSLNYSQDAGVYKLGTGSYVVTRYSLMMQKADMTWEKITNPNAAYSSGTTKTVNTNGFRLGQIKYYSSTSNFASGETIPTNVVYDKAATVDLRYSTNCGNAPAWTAGDYIYLVGTMGADGLFYLDTTTWWTNTLPNSNDGKLYIRLGIFLSDAKSSMLTKHPVFYHNGNRICEYIYADNKQDLLVSGTNIKTVNNNSLLGSGNLDIDSLPSQTGNAGKYLTTDGSDASWGSLASQPFGSFINGLILTRSADDTIGVSAGSCYDSTGAMILTLESDTTKQNGSQAASSTYYIYIIGDGSTVDILITTSPSSPTLPAGYTNYRLLGKYTTDSNNKIQYIYTGTESNPQTVATAIKSYSSGSDGYILFSNKDLIQWFRVANSSSTTLTANLLLTYGNTNYSVTATNVLAVAGATYTAAPLVKSNNKFTFYLSHAANVVEYVDFIVIGKKS